MANEINKARFLELVAWADEEYGKPADEREWDQGLWVAAMFAKDAPKLRTDIDDQLLTNVFTLGCGMTFCAAGKVALQEGYVPYVLGDYEGADEPIEIAQVIDLSTKCREHVEDVAGRVLGLSRVEAHELFKPTHELAFFDAAHDIAYQHDFLIEFINTIGDEWVRAHLGVGAKTVVA